MLRGLYAAATALDSASQVQEVVASNLSHVTTPGYRQRGVTHETFDRALQRATPPTGDIVGTRVSGVFHDFEAGALQHTQAPLDLALGDADTFFRVQGPNGQQLFSRNGTFHLNQAGQIVTQAGYPLLGQGGPITLPPDTTLINIASDGSVTANGEAVTRVQLVKFTNPEKLTAVGPTLYDAPQDAGQLPTEGRILQGYRESSNVNAANEMVQLMIGSRYFDAAQRVLRAIGESVQLNTRPQG